MSRELIYRDEAIDAIAKCTNCNTPEDLREYVAEHSLWSLWSGGVLEALEAVEALPSAPLYTPDEIQTMQDMEWSQMEKMYEIGKAERKRGKWVEIEHTFFHKCSECSWLNDVDSGYAFCPRCGSYNGGEQE